MESIDIVDLMNRTRKAEVVFGHISLLSQTHVCVRGEVEVLLAVRECGLRTVGGCEFRIGDGAVES